MFFFPDRATVNAYPAQCRRGRRELATGRCSFMCSEATRLAPMQHCWLFTARGACNRVCGLKPFLVIGCWIRWQLIRSILD